MNYFKYFPKDFYTTDNFSNVDFVTNIAARFKFLDEVLKQKGAFYPFVVRDGERPDTVADKYYGDSKYAWAIISYNSYIDPLFEWPLSEREFNRYIKRHYGSIEAAKAEIKFYYKTINGRDYIVDSGQAYDKTKTAYDFEFELNEDRRNIKLLDVRMISQLEKEVKEIFE